jgi:hypothetical protein
MMPTMNAPTDETQMTPPAGGEPEGAAADDSQNFEICVTVRDGKTVKEGRDAVEHHTTSGRTSFGEYSHNPSPH